MLLQIPTLDAFITDLKEKKISVVRLATLIEGTPSQYGLMNSYALVLTTIKGDVIISHTIPIGEALAYFEKDVEKVAKAVEIKTNDIINLLKEKGFKIKEGIWKE